MTQLYWGKSLNCRALDTRRSSRVKARSATVSTHPPIRLDSLRGVPR